MSPSQRWLHLSAYLYGELSDEETSKLEVQLAEDPLLAEQIFEIARDEATLAEWAVARTECLQIDEDAAGELGLQRPRPASPIRRQRLLAVFATLAVTAAILVVAMWTVFFRDAPEEPAQRIASLRGIQGSVRVIRADGQSVDAKLNDDIHSGDTIRTQGAQASATLVYADGTQLGLVGDTTITSTDNSSRNIVMDKGNLSANVTKQSSSHPMVLTTPKAKLHVLGTQFFVTTTSTQTGLRVTEGRVKLTRLADGRSVEVTQGQQVVADEQHADLLVKDIGTVPADWSVDFEDGLPDGWEIGKLVADALPTGSTGAVKATFHRDEQQEYYSIVSPSYWLHGAFAVHDDSRFHFSFKMQQPDWLNVFILTRTDDEKNPRFASNFIFNELPFAQVKPGKWYTITIPASKFHRLSAGGEGFDGVVPFQVLVNAPGHDRGLVIDRIWVTRGKGDEVEIEAID